MKHRKRFPAEISFMQACYLRIQKNYFAHYNNFHFKHILNKKHYKKANREIGALTVHGLHELR